MDIRREPQIILLAGKAGVGKDTYFKSKKASLLEQGKKVARVGFADYLKLLCAKEFGYTEAKKTCYRTVLQTVGDDIRSVNINFFVDIVILTIKAFYNNYDYIYVTDARYDNEVMRMKEEFLNVEVVELKRSFVSNLSDSEQCHPTETGISKYLIDRIEVLD